MRVSKVIIIYFILIYIYLCIGGFLRAVQRNLLKDLDSYSILKNPVYKERFAISWGFARTHRRASDVRLSASSIQGLRASRRVSINKSHSHAEGTENGSNADEEAKASEAEEEEPEDDDDGENQGDDDDDLVKAEEQRRLRKSFESDNERLSRISEFRPSVDSNKHSSRRHSSRRNSGSQHQSPRDDELYVQVLPTAVPPPASIRRGSAIVRTVDTENSQEPSVAPSFGLTPNSHMDTALRRTQGEKRRVSFTNATPSHQLGQSRVVPPPAIQADARNRTESAQLTGIDDLYGRPSSLSERYSAFEISEQDMPNAGAGAARSRPNSTNLRNSQLEFIGTNMRRDSTPKRRGSATGKL